MDDLMILRSLVADVPAHDEVASSEVWRRLGLGHSRRRWSRPRVRELRQARAFRPRPSVRLAIVVAVIFVLLSGVATATYLVLRNNGGIALGGGTSLPVINPDGPGLHAVANCSAQRPSCTISEPSWSPDGTRVAFLRGIYGGPKDRSRISLYVARTDGRGLKRLVSCGGCGSGLAWSPDGKRIAFGRDDGLHPQSSLWIVASAGGKPHRLTECSGTCADTEPVWSPTGNLLAFQRTRAELAPPTLYTIRADGSQLTRIASGADPAWSPDGSRIAFHGPDGIEVANANGSAARLLFAGEGDTAPASPAWSPDSQKLVFYKNSRVSSPAGFPSPVGFTFEVWTMNADGSEQQRLYHSGCCAQGWAPPIWSPDGRLIAFSANSADGTFVMNADGSGLRRISPETYLSLSWQGLPRH